MNWEYISGFFDADGSITLTKNSKNEKATIQIAFHNNEKVILEKIKDFIKIETNHTGFISHKKSKNVNHKDAYDLKYSNFNKCLDILNKMHLEHPKKNWRKHISLKIKEYTLRNGKYNIEILEQRFLWEQKFFEMR